MDTHTKIIKGGYFKVIRDTEDYIEMMSKNTGHCWVIKYCDRKEDYPYILFHKHGMSIPFYHKHWQTTSFERAVKSIKSHDSYVLSRNRSITHRKRIKEVLTHGD